MKIPSFWYQISLYCYLVRWDHGFVLSCHAAAPGMCLVCLYWKSCPVEGCTFRICLSIFLPSDHPKSDYCRWPRYTWAYVGQLFYPLPQLHLNWYLGMNLVRIQIWLNPHNMMVELMLNQDSIFKNVHIFFTIWKITSEPISNSRNSEGICTFL